MALLLILATSALLLHLTGTPWWCTTMASPSSSSWWDGMKFGDRYHDKNDTVTQERPSGGPMLQVPCGLIVMTDTATTDTHNHNKELDDVLPLSTIIDTSLSVSTLHPNALQKYPQLQQLQHVLAEDETMMIPSSGTNHNHNLLLRLDDVTVPAPPLIQVSSPKDKLSSSSEWDLRLGLDFLRQHQAILTVGGDDDESLQLRLLDENNNHNNRVVVSIPFLRPRPSLEFGDTTNSADRTEL